MFFNYNRDYKDVSQIKIRDLFILSEMSIYEAFVDGDVFGENTSIALKLYIIITSPIIILLIFWDMLMDRAPDQIIKILFPINLMFFAIINALTKMCPR